MYTNQMVMEEGSCIDPKRCFSLAYSPLTYNEHNLGCLIRSQVLLVYKSHMECENWLKDHYQTIQVQMYPRGACIMELPYFQDYQNLLDRSLLPQDFRSPITALESTIGRSGSNGGG